MAETLPTKLHLTIVTRERKLVDVEVDEVVLPAANGQMGVLPGHTPLLAMLGVGELMYRVGSTQRRMVVTWGFAEVLPERVIVLAEGATPAEEIDRAQAERDRVESEKELMSLASHDAEFAVLKARLDESIVKIQLSGRAAE